MPWSQLEPLDAQRRRPGLHLLIYVSHNQNFVKGGGHIGDYIGDYYRSH